MEDTKQATIIARTFAVLATAVGAYVICITVPSFLKNCTPIKNVTDFVLLFVFPLPLFIAIGGYSIYSGYRLWFKISPENTRRISFITSTVLCFLLIPVFRFLLKSDEIGNLLAPLLMIPAGIFFLFFNRLLARLLNLPTAADWARREKSAKRYFGWFAFFLWPVISFLLSRLLPETLNTIEALLCMACSAVVAYCVYKLGVAIALRNKPKEPEITPYPSINS